MNDSDSLASLILAKLRDSETYVVALVVGLLINLYGHVLVPVLRGSAHPLDLFMTEFRTHPGLVTFSVALGFFFPLCVGLYSAVSARYQTRHFASLAEFPNHKPDPVFRAARDGTIIEAGEQTRELFRAHGVDRAQDILGDGLWRELLASADGGTPSAKDTRVYFEPQDQWYLVAYSRAAKGLNVYLSVLPTADGGRPTH